MMLTAVQTPAMAAVLSWGVDVVEAAGGAAGTAAVNVVVAWLLSRLGVSDGHAADGVGEVLTIRLGSGFADRCANCSCLNK